MEGRIDAADQADEGGEQHHRQGDSAGAEIVDPERRIDEGGEGGKQQLGDRERDHHADERDEDRIGDELGDQLRPARAHHLSDPTSRARRIARAVGQIGEIDGGDAEDQQGDDQGESAPTDGPRPAACPATSEW